MRALKVLLKPNLISAQGRGLAVTDGRLVLALVDFLLDHGASVCIGDSPAFGSARWVLRGIGLEKELKVRNVVIADFQRVAERRLASGRKVGVAADIYDCDLLLNVPKVKGHAQMYVTLGVKNLFGIVKGVRKSMLHMRLGDAEGAFAGLILDLLDILPPNITLVDGIVALHRGGPIYGEPLELGCLAFAEDAVAVDRALLDVLELDPEKSPLFREAQRRSYAAAELENLHFPLKAPGVFHGSCFQPPEDIMPIRFNPFRFLKGNVKRICMKVSGR